MALTNEDFFELRDMLDTLYREQASDVEVSTIEGQGTTVKIGPTSYGSIIFGFEDLPGVQRMNLAGNSFGGWEAEYALAGGDVLQELKLYKTVEERKRRVREAFLSPDDVESFRKKLQSAGCRVRVIGSDIMVEDPWLKSYLAGFAEELAGKGTEEKQQDVVNHPSHYSSESGLEAIEVIEAFFHGNAFLANTFKYIARAGKKGGEAKRLEDLRKAQWYLDREIKREEAH